MKIVCGSCGAKYSIADEKVAGKSFKIRCKRCNEPIVVRGDVQGAGEIEEGPTVFEPGGVHVWHVVVQGEQQGPLSKQQVVDMFSAGNIEWEDYVWREGYEGWKPLREVEELVQAIPNRPASAAPAASARPAANNDPFAPVSRESQPARASSGPSAASAAPSRGGSTGPFAFQSGSGGVAHRASRDGGADLFAQQQAAPASGGGFASSFGGGRESEQVMSSPAASAAPSPRVTVDEGLTGQRNENSVLFSLSNLQALATTGPAKSGGGAVPAAPAASKPGVTEGSGLIDIRALASATLTTRSAPSNDRSREVDDLLSIGPGVGGLSALTAPVLAPAKEPEEKSKTPMVAIISAAVVVALAAVIALVVVLTRKPETVTVTAPAVVGAPGVADAAIAAAPTPNTNPTTPTTEAKGTPTTAAKGGAEAEGERGGKGGKKRGGRREGGPAVAEKGGKGSEAAPAATPPPAEKGGRSGDIDSLLEAALGGKKGGKGGESAAADSSLPDTPDRSAVLDALRSVQDAVRACGEGQHGVANANITVAGPTGKVSSASVSGQFAGTPVAACVARAVRGAKFPRFKRPTFKVSFPYSI